MTTRRDFLKTALAGGAALTLGGIAPGFSAKSYNNIAGANDKIRIGMIGVNSRGKGIASGLAKLPECEITYICDVDSRAIEKCQEVVRKITGKTPKGIKDLREMVQKEDVDAVVVATPDHWHAPAAIIAMQAGKHVYLEKPTSHNPAENEMLIRAAAKYGVVVQVGNQRRSWPNVQAGIEEVLSGNIGTVKYAKAQFAKEGYTYKVMNDKGDIIDSLTVEKPCHWGTGEALNNGTHFVDMLRWGLNVDWPTKVDSIGGRYFYEDDWEFADTQLITYQFGDKASCSWEGRSCQSQPVDGQGLGVAFYGEKATLFLSGGNDYKIKDHKGKIIKDVKSNLAFEEGNLLNPSEALDAFHFRNWFDGIRKGAKLNSGLVDACMSTQLVQYGNIAQAVGHSLDIDPMTGRILNDDREVRKLWSRKYEKGWEPKIK